MKFNLFNRSFNLGRYSKYTLLVLTISFFALGAKFASSASMQKKSFRIAEAVTQSADGKTVTAKPGFELVRKGANGFVARRVEKHTEISSDTKQCTCFVKIPPGVPPGATCKMNVDNTVQVTCSGNCTACRFE